MADLVLGGGAQFWAYISPQNETAKKVTKWSVTITQGNWTGKITSADPQAQLKTKNLSGVFQVTVTGSGPNMPEQKIPVQPGSKPDVGCNSNCAAMVGIVANPAGTSANYWTTWDAMCSRKPR
jgi:hypothetical protein